MSYDIHITRKADWATERGPKISSEEWKIYVDGRADLRWGDYPHTVPGETIVEMLDSEGEVFTSFWWSRGNITMKRPQRHDIEQMILIARDLNARVMGDDGETYHDPDRPYDSRPARYDPSNLTNEWQEPTDDERSFTMGAAPAVVRVSETVVPQRRPEPVVQSPAVSVSRALFALALAFAVLGGAIFWLLASLNEFDNAAIVIVITAVLVETCVILRRGVRKQQRRAVLGAKGFSFLLLVSVPIGTFVGLYLLKQLTQIAPVERN